MSPSTPAPGTPHRTPPARGLSDQRRPSSVPRWMAWMASAVGLILLPVLLFPSTYWELWGLMAGYLVPPAGKETYLPLGVGLGYPPWLLAGLIAGLDLLTSSLVAWNADLLARIPWLGPRLERSTHRAAEQIAASRWTRLGATGAIAGAALLPMQGTGPMAAAAGGRALGLSPLRAWMAVAAGALVAAFAWAYAAGGLLAIAGHIGWARVVQVAVLAAAGTIALVLLTRQAGGV